MNEVLPDRRHGWWTQTLLMLAGLAMTVMVNTYWLGGEFGRLQQSIMSLERSVNEAVMRPEFDSELRSSNERMTAINLQLTQKINSLSGRIDDHFSHHGNIEKKVESVRTDLLRKMEKMEDKIYSLLQKSRS